MRWSHQATCKQYFYSKRTIGGIKNNVEMNHVLMWCVFRHCKWDVRAFFHELCKLERYYTKEHELTHIMTSYQGESTYMWIMWYVWEPLKRKFVTYEEYGQPAKKFGLFSQWLTLLLSAGNNFLRITKTCPIAQRSSYIHGACEIMLYVGRVHCQAIILFSTTASFLLSQSNWHFDFPTTEYLKYLYC